MSDGMSSEHNPFSVPPIDQMGSRSAPVSQPDFFRRPLEQGGGSAAGGGFSDAELRQVQLNAMAYRLAMQGDVGLGSPDFVPDPNSPESGAMVDMGSRQRFRESELGDMLMNSRNVGELREAVERAFDVLDGVPDEFTAKRMNLIREKILTPEPQKVERGDYTLYRTLMSRLDRAGHDLAIRIRKAKVVIVNKDKIDFQSEVNGAIADGSIKTRGVELKDVRTWKYLKQREEQRAKLMVKLEINDDGELCRMKPDLFDPEVQMIQEGWAEKFIAKMNFHDVWATRQITSGDADEAAKRFIEKGRTTMKGHNWEELFPDGEHSTHIDRALRAMVDVAYGVQVKWEQTGRPGGSKTETPMWMIMAERRYAKDVKFKTKVDGEIGADGDEGARREFFERNRNSVDWKSDLAWENPYPWTFKSNKVFEEWFEYVLDEAGGDVRAVFAAWKFFQVSELISRKGIGSTRLSQKETAFGDPPTVSDAAARIDFAGKRMKEYGIDENGRRLPDRGDTKYPAGPPVTIFGIPSVGATYMDNAGAAWQGEGVRSLYHLWYERGIELSKLPWMATDDPGGWESEEVGPHSWDGHLYRTMQANTVALWALRWNVTVGDLLKPDDAGNQQIQKLVKARNKGFGVVYADARKRAEEQAKYPDAVIYEPFTSDAARDPNKRGKLNPGAWLVVGWLALRNPDASTKLLGDQDVVVSYDNKLSKLDPSSDRPISPGQRQESIKMLKAVVVGFGLVSESEWTEALKYTGVRI